LTGEEKQEIINSQLKSKQERMQAEARREGKNVNNPNNQNQQESSEEESSDWDDWQDPDYIEEQRKALIEFE